MPRANLPGAADLDSTYNYTVAALALDDVGREPVPNRYAYARFSVAAPVTLSGRIITQVGGLGVGNIVVKLTGKAANGSAFTAQATTAADGTYQFLKVPPSQFGNPYVVTPALDPETYTPNPTLIEVKDRNISIPTIQVLDALPKVGISHPGDPSVLKSSEGLKLLDGGAVAGPGRKIKTFAVYLIRQPKDSNDPNLAQNWGFPTGATTPSWMAKSAAGQRALPPTFDVALPSQKVTWAVAEKWLPHGADLDSTYQYHVAVTVTDDRDRKPAKGREGDEFTRAFFTVAEPVFEFKFIKGLTSSQTARACAGGVANDGVHSVQLLLQVKRDGQLWDGALQFAFQGDKSHNNNPDKFAKLRQTDDASSLFVRTLQANSKAGLLRLTLLSCDVICQPTLIIKKQDSKGQWQPVPTTLKCDFAAAQSIRNFPDQYDPNYDPATTKDTGWLFIRPWLTNPGDEAPAKIYMKFKVDLGKGDAYGNWKVVNGHQMLMKISRVTPRGTEGTTDSRTYATFGADGTVVLTTKGDGAAQAIVKAQANITKAKQIWLGAVDLTQHRK